jgi:hypothetical protein
VYQLIYRFCIDADQYIIAGSVKDFIWQYH